nr:DUF2934 domain-containing protein [uncultured Pseudomonas sp.]
MSIDEQRIRDFAYQIWEAEGKPEGQAARHWSMACKLAESEAQGERPPSPPARKVSKPREVPSVTQGKAAAEKPALLKKPRASTRKADAKPPKPSA